MLMIRLQRVGRKNDPSYRIVVTEKQNAAKSGKSLEIVGSYDARVNRRTLNAERISYWLSMGAKASDTVHNILVTEGLISGQKINILPKNKNRKPEPVPGAIISEVAPEALAEITPETIPEPIAEIPESVTLEEVK